MDYENEDKFLTWRIDRAIMAPTVGLDFRQGWPYAPYHAVIMALPYARRALVFFLALTVLTLLLLNHHFSLVHISLLAGLFSIPALVLMSGGLPLPASVPMGQYAEYQVRLFPAISLVPLVLAFFALGKMPRLPRVLVLALMTLFLCGYPQISLVLDEQKRNTVLGAVEIGMIVYIFLLSLYSRITRR